MNAKIHVLLISFLLMLFFPTAMAQALSCAPLRTLQDVFGTTDLIFVGRVKSLEPDRYRAVFIVEAFIKKPSSLSDDTRELFITKPPMDYPGAPYFVDNRYIVYAFNPSYRKTADIIEYESSSCTWTKRTPDWQLALLTKLAKDTDRSELDGPQKSYVEHLYSTTNRHSSGAIFLGTVTQVTQGQRRQKKPKPRARLAGSISFEIETVFKDVDELLEGKSTISLPSSCENKFTVGEKFIVHGEAYKKRAPTESEPHRREKAYRMSCSRYTQSLDEVELLRKLADQKQNSAN